MKWRVTEAIEGDIKTLRRSKVCNSSPRQGVEKEWGRSDTEGNLLKAFHNC